MALLRLLHAENSLEGFAMDEDMVRNTLRRAFNRQGGIVGVIGEPGHLEAGIYLSLSQMWYSAAWHLAELWNFVHPDHRRSPHAKSMIAFAKHCAEELSVPLIIGIVSNERTEAKVRLYERQLAKPAGAFFIWNGRTVGAT